MSRPGITAEQVIAAAIRLLARGENPSVRNVRQEMGNTGSNSTILTHLEAWRATLNERNLEVLPPGLPPALEEPLRLLWAAAVESASDSYAEHKKALEAETRAAREAREVAEARNRELTNEVQRLEGLIGERTRALENSQGELVRERERSQALEQQTEAVRKEAAQALAETRAEARRDREALEGRIGNLEGQLAREVERFDAQQQHWIAQVDAARRDTSQVRESADRQIRQASDDLKQARDRQGELERKLATSEADRQRLVQEGQNLTGERERLRERIEKLNATLERRAGALAVLRDHWRSTARTAQEVGADPELDPQDRTARLGQILALPGMLDEVKDSTT